MTQSLPLRPLALVAILCGLPAAQPASASDIHFVLQVEPAVALWLDDPQSERFTPGFYGAIRPGLALGDVVSLQASYALMVTPPKAGFSDTGGAHSLTGGVRLRPFGAAMQPEKQLGGLWLDGNLGYIRTGELNRFGFDAGLGYGFQVSPGFALGPAVRYTHLLQPNELAGVDPRDGQLLTAGLNMSFGAAHAQPDEPVVEVLTPVLQTPVDAQDPPVALTCPDYDRDTVCDTDDRCPTQAGTASTMGCAVDPCTGEPLVVVVQFAYDSAGLPVWDLAMDPVLDAVALAVAQNPTCRVCVAGYASDEGTSAYNLKLSGRRAAAVQAYLVARGVARKRIPTTALGEMCPQLPEGSLSMDRRVEFRRLEEGQSCPTNCQE